jgi:hypothetical protein
MLSLTKTQKAEICIFWQFKHAGHNLYCYYCNIRMRYTKEFEKDVPNFIKIVFLAYKERKPHYNYSPINEYWVKIEKVCKPLEVF